MTATVTVDTGVPDRRQAWPDRGMSALSSFLRWRWAEPAVAVAAFGALCVVVLTKGAALLEPDDYAYRASIVALSHGQVLLTTAQYQALAHQLGSGTGIAQWVQLPSGRWISEKNPGYPFFAVLFQVLGLLRLAPLFYGALASGALYAGARRWLGRWGGAAAVVLFCTSGAAITFAWRATMPTFTDSSLVATGAGLLLWAMLAVEQRRARRLVAGVGAFVALEAATSIRYTDAAELAVAVVVALAFARRAGIDRRMLVWWMATVAVFAAGVLAFDAVVYGAPLRTGYGAGEITFSLSAIWPNLLHMPRPLVEAMPMMLLALLAVAWTGLRLRGRRGLGPVEAGARSRDAVVAGSLLAGWAVVWGLYLAYTWTVGQASHSAAAVHVIRFYLPALGPISLLGAWAVRRLRGVVAVPVLLTVGVLGILSFHGLSTATLGPGGGFPGGPGGPGGGFPGGPGGQGGGLPGGPGGAGGLGRGAGGTPPAGAPFGGGPPPLGGFRR